MFVSDVWSSVDSFQEKAFTSGEALIEDFSHSLPLQSLFREAQNMLHHHDGGHGPLKVCIEPTRSGFDVETQQNIIRIKPGFNAAQQRFLFAQGLSEVIQVDKHIKVRRLAAGFKTADEYAQAVLFIHYTGLKLIKGIVLNPKNGRFIRRNFESGYLNMPLENMEFNRFCRLDVSDKHKEFYREVWREINKSNSSEKVVDIKKTERNNEDFCNVIRGCFGVFTIAAVFVLTHIFFYAVGNQTKYNCRYDLLDCFKA